jgi:predicted DCC family thiol-disulfide oxidoreductase YuxK
MNHRFTATRSLASRSTLSLASRLMPRTGYIDRMPDSPSRPPTQALPERVVFFDGVCGFCNQAIRWLMVRDPHRRLHYASLQGEVAAALRSRHAEFPQDIDTIVLFERGKGGEHVHLRSDAVLRIFAVIDGPWRRLVWLRVLPSPILDWGYRLFARHRYRMFGQLDACPTPSEDERARFVP